MSDPCHVQIVLGSTRQGRMSPTVGSWVARHVAQRDDMTVEIVDLLDHVLPLYDDPGQPLTGQIAPQAEGFVATLDRADAFVFVTPEYNHGMTGVLKNAIDHAFFPWRRKPAGYVGYGGLGATRAVEQLRLVNLTAGMAPLGMGVHVSNHREAFDAEGNMTNPAMDAMLDRMLGDLSWWAHALRTARRAD